MCVLGGSVPPGALAQTSSPGQLKPFSLEAARAIVSVSSPAISPDGTRVVFVRSHADYTGDKTVQELVMVDVRTGASRVLTRDRDAVASPQWSPSGDRLAFIAKKGTAAQLFVMPMNGGDAQAVTEAKAGVSEFAWKPDGTALAYIARDEAPNAKDIEDHHDAFEAGDADYLTRAAAVPSHVWTVGAAGDGAVKLTSGLQNDSALSARANWSPDGSSLTYVRASDAQLAHFPQERVVRYDFATHSEHEITTGASDFAAYSRDGSRLLYFAPRHGSLYLQRDAYVVDATSHTALADSLAIDRNAQWAAFLPDGGFAYAASDGIRHALWFVSREGKARRIDLGDIDFAPSATVADDGSIAFVGESTKRPPEIYVLPAAGVAPRRLTNENAIFDTYDLAVPQEITWTTADGLHADGVLFKPPGFQEGKTYPLVLVIHGGPVSTSTHNFSVLAQALASHGFLVFSPNYRGSDNAGDAFLEAIVGHPASGPGDDNLAGLAAVEKLGIVDTSRIGVSGWSGGGLQTSWLIGHSHVWKAAMTGAGVDDWFEQAVLADINEQFADIFMGGQTPWTAEGRALFTAESPITYVDRMTTPTLILSDDRDQRVPVTQSYALFHALEERGTRVKFVAFPRYGHFPADPVGLEAVYRTWTDWFATELK